MGLEHLSYPVVRQGSEGMACWAACLSWYGKAVRHFNYTMEEIARRYAHLMAAPTGGNNIGGMDDVPRGQMLRDPIWRLDYFQSNRDNIDLDLRISLNSSPVLFTYYDPKLNNGKGGTHMNVIVARIENSDKYWIMDPDYDTYQQRTLQYYTEKYSIFNLGSLRNASVAGTTW
jgi:hypothetical protein